MIAKIKRICKIKAGFREIMQSVGGLNDTPRSSMDVICWRMASLYDSCLACFNCIK